MSERLCIFCKHFGWERMGFIYYSEETGGDEEVGCSAKRATS